MDKRIEAITPDFDSKLKGMTAKLIAVMQYRGMKQRELAELSGVSDAAISQICNYKRALRDIETVIRLSLALNIESAYFLDTDNRHDMFHYLAETKPSRSDIALPVSVIPNIQKRKPDNGCCIKFIKAKEGVSAFALASGETVADGYIEIPPTNNANLLGMVAVQIDDDSMSPYLMKKDIAVIVPLDIEDFSHVVPEKVYAVNFSEPESERVGSCLKRIAPFDGGYMLYHDNRSYISKCYVKSSFRLIWGEVVCVFRASQ